MAVIGLNQVECPGFTFSDHFVYWFFPLKEIGLLTKVWLNSKLYKGLEMENLSIFSGSIWVCECECINFTAFLYWDYSRKSSHTIKIGWPIPLQEGWKQGLEVWAEMPIYPSASHCVDSWVLGWLLQLIGEYKWVHFHTWVLIFVLWCFLYFVSGMN